MGRLGDAPPKRRLVRGARPQHDALHHLRTPAGCLPRIRDGRQRVHLGTARFLRPARQHARRFFHAVAKPGRISARPRYCFPKALDGLLDRCFFRYLKPEIPGNGIDPGRIERNAAAIEGGDQAACLLDVGKRRRFRRQQAFQPADESFPSARRHKLAHRQNPKDTSASPPAKARPKTFVPEWNQGV